MESTTPPEASNNIVKPINPPSSKMPIFLGLAAIVILAGLGVGWFVSGKKAANSVANKAAGVPAVVVTQTEAGVTDPSTIKDVTTATGTLQTGGIRGEGTYHLDRPGGSTQTVYLNSTIVNMKPFVSAKVQVWGQTQASQYAPWLMDVSKIKMVQ